MSSKTKQILIYALVAILALSGITAAAQAFAPDNLKPFKVAKSEGSSSSLSSSISSSFVSGSSMSSVSSSSSLASSIVSSASTATTVKTQTYTNQYFPDFKLVYPEDWKLTSDTKEGSLKGLLNNFVYLNKNSYKITIQLTPFQIGCGGSGAVKNTINLKNGLKRFIISASADNPNDTRPATVGYGTNAINCPYTNRF
jgi:hypothetical protein